LYWSFLKASIHLFIHSWQNQKASRATSNNKIFAHYRAAACEYIVQNTLKGVRRGQSRAIVSLLFALLLLSLTLLFSSLALLSSAEYLASKGAAGKRSRDDSDEDGLNDSVSLGSDDTEEDMPPRKTSATPCPAKKPAGAPKNDDVDELVDRLKEIKFPAGQTSGHNYDCILPHHWQVYTIRGHKYLRINFLS
jgi:hypothetical protein